MKARPPTRGCSRSTRPTSSPSPATRWRTSAGTPASHSARQSAAPENGAWLDGLKTTVLPATRAAPTMPPASASGKLKGETTPKTP